MALPILAAQAGIGALQALIGGGKARKAQRQLESMVDSYQKSESIMDFYNKALQRYNQNPYTSSLYQNQMQNAGRGLATGIGALQDRRSALAGVGGLVQGYNDSALRAAAAAEQQQAQNLSQLGQATQLKDREDKYKFENKYNLLSMKAGAGNQTANAGFQNIFGSIGGLSDLGMLNKMYGKSNNLSTSASKIAKNIGRSAWQ